MNTKILVISIALIFTFPQSVSVGASYQKQGIHVQNEDQALSSTGNKSNSRPLDWTFDWSYQNASHHSNNHDDDNKSHHFHYNRFSKNRKRILVGFLLKILLVLAHISSLIYASIHILY